MVDELEQNVKPAPKRRGRPPNKRVDEGTQIAGKPKKGPGRPRKARESSVKQLSATESAPKIERPASEVKYVFAVGRRKRSIARVFVFREGKGDIEVNNKPLAIYLPKGDLQEIVFAPLEHSPFKKRVRVVIFTRGGGIRGQAEAMRLGITRALLKMDENFRPTFRARGYLTRDPREKERKKPGLKRARRAPQWQKR